MALVACRILRCLATITHAPETDAPDDDVPVAIDVDAPPRVPGELERNVADDGAFLWFSVGECEPTGAVSTEHGDDDVAPGLHIVVFAFMIIALFVVVVLLVVGTALLAAAIVIAVGLSAGALVLGLASSSTFVGLSRRSFGAGFEALLAQTGAIAGLPCGVAAAWVAYYLARSEFTLDVSRTTSLLLGGLSGLAAGAILGLLTARAIRLTLAFVRGKLGPSSSPTPSPPSPASAP